MLITAYPRDSRDCRLRPYQSCMLLLLVMLLSACVQGGVYHRVKAGQTLYRISKTYQINEAYLARVNGISDPTQIKVGRRLFVPGAKKAKYVPATVKQVKSTKTFRISKSKIRQPSSVQKKRSLIKSRPVPPRSSTSKVKTVAIPAASVRNKSFKKHKIRLRWPLRGKILSPYGPVGKKSGRGVEIAAKVGSSVVAAAAGKVIYSGNGVSGYGHLIILQHENDLFTVYGFNLHNLVKQGRFVSQGEKIAKSGRPPSGGKGRLHFEVRLGKKAVNPILYLP